MLIYESGMSQQQFVSVMMEAAETTTRLRLCIMMNLAPSDRQIVRKYQQNIQAYFEARKMPGFLPLQANRLHVSLSAPFIGTDLLRGNLYQDLAQFNKVMTLPYLDTNSDDRYLVVELGLVPEFSSVRQGVAQALHKYGIKLGKEWPPHMILGKNAPDTPDESITTNPGFKELHFQELVITAAPA
jgi:hypothetical protein